MNSDIIKTDVIAIKFYKNYILAGIGNYLHIYQRCNLSLIFKKEIFDGQKIHGINCESKPLIIFGGRELYTFTLHLQEEYNVDKFINNLHKIQYDDWILDAIINRNEIITISAHNVAIGIDLNDNSSKWETACDVNSILYGATIAKKNDELFILAGTVFSEILIWSPKFSNVLYRLTGHKGVIFSITWNEKRNMICSTSDDRTVRLWKTNLNLTNIDIRIHQIIEIKPKIVMYGHTARVMRAKILSDCIISIGEDSLINIWDYNGKHLRKIESHQNDCIWSVDYDETYNQLITGGGDSGICLHSIKEDVRKNVIVCPTNNDTKNVFKKLCFLNESNIVIITELGTLFHFNCNSGLKIVEEMKGFQKILLEVSPDRVHVAVVGNHNVIFIYQLIKCELNKKKTIKIDINDAILSLHWLNGCNLLICDSMGTLKIGNINDEIFNTCGILPKSKERWTTAACKYKQLIIVGDRGGNIHLYENNRLQQTLSKVHGRLGIPCLKIINSILITTGRDGMVKKFKINENSKNLEIYSSIKIPFKWCANIIHNQSLVIGFLGFNFVIWSMNLHRKIFEYNCGGGHRSWDLYILDKNHFKFIFIKDKYVHEITVSTDSFRNLEQGFHSHEINTIIPIVIDNKLIAISGGEDTTLRVSQYTKSNFKVISTHNFHLSSVRCLYSNQLTNNESLIYSAGGRAQLVVSKLIYDNNSIEFDTILSHSLKFNKEFDPETRIMDIISLKFDNMNYLIFIACSDGNLRVFRYKYTENQLNFVFSNSFHNCCITKLGLLKTNQLIILSMDTNGKIFFWNFSFLLTNENVQNIKPFFIMKIHQSAINSFYYKQYSNHVFLIATGGDDCKLNLSLIAFFSNDVKILSSWYAEKYFCSQITGILIIDDILFACSTDQRVTAYEIFVSDGKHVNCKFITQKCSTISDLLGLCNFTAANMDNYAICVYGKGLEVFQFNKNVSL